jgi:polyhydroxyalkanoate synthase
VLDKTDRSPLVGRLQNSDRALHAAEGAWTGGLSPIATGLAFADWMAHLMNAPFRQVELALEAQAALQPPAPAREPAPVDARFSDAGWSQPPFSHFRDGFQASERWWKSATTGVHGVEAAHERIVAFTVRQMLDMVCPANLPWLNPEVIARTRAEGGANLRRGALAFLKDLAGDAAEDLQSPPYVVGKTLAITPGKVVLRNRLVELIQYAPSTGTVRPEPILITPAWINKYYILDLRPQNSLIKFLVDQGFTVFCLSWRNPDERFRETALDDYRTLGVMAAIDAVTTICNGSRIHLCGYCLGGTLAALTAAAIGRDGDDRLASLTLLAAQTDFTEAGELELFTTESQIAFLEDIMAERGYLSGAQMAGAFQMLRSSDLIWSRALHAYWLGDLPPPSDLMVWNADTTRMPSKMHSEYLRRFFLNNDLAEGRFPVGDAPVSLNDIRTPLFVVGTENDHVSPWRSVFKIHILSEQEITFVLTSGGHNAGIVSEPGHLGRHYRQGRRPCRAPYVGPGDWMKGHAAREGSWWPAWCVWLATHSGAAIAPPAMGGAAGADLGDAPGTYVKQA